MAGMRFNPPPNWPVPQEWSPPADWMPDPSWPPAPPGWQFWLGGSDPREVDDADWPAEVRKRGNRRAVLSALVICLVGAAISAAAWWTHISRPASPATPMTCENYAEKGFYDRSKIQADLLQSHGLDGVAASNALTSALTEACELNKAGANERGKENGNRPIDDVIDWKQISLAANHPYRDP